MANRIVEWTNEIDFGDKDIQANDGAEQEKQVEPNEDAGEEAEEDDTPNEEAGEEEEEDKEPSEGASEMQEECEEPREEACAEEEEKEPSEGASKQYEKCEEPREEAGEKEEEHEEEEEESAPNNVATFSEELKKEISLLLWKWPRIESAKKGIQVKKKELQERPCKDAGTEQKIQAEPSEEVCEEDEEEEGEEDEAPGKSKGRWKRHCGIVQ